MFLRINSSRKIELAGCLNNRCILRNPVDLPPCLAELVVIIDGDEISKRVYLGKGISTQSLEAELTEVSNFFDRVKFWAMSLLKRPQIA